MASTALSVDFLRAYAKLPRKAQRKADAFLEKFRADPKAPGLHAEPIQDVRDKCLRSVRVGDDYRAIVRAPEKGDVFVVLWVDHHDEAYRWAKGKRTEVHPSTGTLQVFDVDAAESAVSPPAPVSEHPPGLVEEAEETDEDASVPGLFSELDDDQLFVGGVPRALIPSVRAVRSDDELERLLPHLPEEAGEVLTGLAAGIPLDDVLAEVLDRTTAPPPVDTADVAAALKRPTSQRRFRLLDEDFDLEAALRYPLDAWRVFLHPKQKTIVRARTKGPMRVLGAAGTGKTVVAMHRAAFLAQHVYTGDDDRILFTTFTRNLAADLQMQLEKLLPERALERVEIINLDAWATRLLSRVGAPWRMAREEDQQRAWNRAIDLYGLDEIKRDFYLAEWRDVVLEQDIRDDTAYVRCKRRHRGTPLPRSKRREIWPVFAHYRSELEDRHLAEPIDLLREARRRVEAEPSLVSYCTVVVDETQDLSSEALKLVRALAGEEHPDDLFLVGDSHQRIYGRPVALSTCGINVRGRRSRYLRLNYRTTAAISRWSLTALRGEEFDDLDTGTVDVRGYTSLREGRAPEVRHFNDAAEEQKFVVDEVRALLDSGEAPDNICICARTHSQLRSAYGPALEAAGIDYEELGTDKPRSSSVRLATMHRIKGLEFPVVFVAGVNEGLMPLRTPELTTDDPVVARLALLRERCLLYVASSRARDLLYVSSYGRRSRFLDVAAQAPRKEASKETTRRLSERPPPPVAASEPAPAGLDVLVDQLALPTRILNWAEGHRVRTLADLARWAPADLMRERNVGRKSVVETRTLLEARLGEAWEVVRARLVPPEEDTGGDGVPPGEIPHWNALATYLLPSVLDTDPREIELPARLHSFCDKRGFQQLRQLVQIRAADLVAERNLGRGSVKQGRDAIVDYAQREQAEQEIYESGFLESWKAQLSPIESVRRMVLTIRSGIAGRTDTLASIGEMLGVSRERVRQHESAAIEQLMRRRSWLSEVAQRLEAALVGGAVRVGELAEDDWWRGVDDRVDALDYFLDRILGTGYRVVSVEDDQLVAKCDQTTLDETARELDRAAKKIATPAPEERFRALFLPLRERLGTTLTEALWNQFEERLNVEKASDGSRRVLTYGDTKDAQVLAFIRASDSPVSVHDIYERFGRVKIPDEAMFFRRGLVGVEKHFPDFEKWKERLVPEVVAVMQERGPTRQWLIPELFEDIAESVDLPAWLGHWHLAGLVRRSDQIEYLGRLRVALPGAADEGGRIFLRDALEKVLREHGQPMDRSEIVQRAHDSAGISDGAASMTLLQAPFVRIDDRRFGLIERDLPGGSPAIARFGDELEAALVERQAGVSPYQLAELLHAFDAPISTWTSQMAVSIARIDPRFRISRSASVGLADWESVRVPSRKAIVEQALARGNGRASVADISASIEELYGERPTAETVGQIAYGLGARRDGDELLRG